MSHNVPIRASGAVTYWSLSDETDHIRLKQELNTLGFGGRCPDPREGVSALKSAMVRVYGGKGHMIRPLEDPAENGFVAVEENRGPDQNDYCTTARARVTADGEVEVSPRDREPDLRAEFEHQKSVLTNHQTAKALVEIAVEDLLGKRLRPSGAIYWIPDQHLSVWEHVIRVVEGAACGQSPSSVYLLRTIYDASSVRAVKDALVQEIQQRSTEIDQRIQGGTLGQRGYRARAKDAARLHDRIAAYEGILGETLAELHTLADTTKGHVMEAGLAAFPDLFGDQSKAA